MNANKLKGKIIENGFTIPEIAKKVNIDVSTFYRKLNSEGKNITVKEATILSSLLNLNSEDINDIFFNN